MSKPINRPKKRTPKSKTKQREETLLFLDAMKFAFLAQRKTGNFEFETHCRIKDGKIKSFDGTLFSICNFPVDIEIYPKSEYLLKALQKNTGKLNLTKMKNGSLRIKSTTMQNTIACLVDDLRFPKIDYDLSLEQKLSENEALQLLTCLKTLYPIVNSSGGLSVLDGSICLQGGSALATHNRVLIVEYWHGIQFNQRFALPVDFVKKACSVKKDIRGYYADESSFGLIYSDGSALITKLLQERWPSIDTFNKMLANNEKLWPPPEDFFDKIETISEFCEDYIYFISGFISSENDIERGSNVECDYCEGDQIFKFENLLMIRNLAKKMILANEKGNLYFQGDNVRGLISKVIA